MDMITITHTPAEGTLVTGDTRPYKETLKAHRLRWGMIGAWYIPNSRDRRPEFWKIEALAGALRAQGVSVTIDLDERATTTAEREANKAERLDERRAALSAKAERKGRESAAAFDRVHGIADRIPMGQPILVGHHSERGHRRDIDRMDRGMRAGIEAGKEAEEAARKVEASARLERHKYTAPAIMRKIEKFEAEQRADARELDKCRFALRTGRDVFGADVTEERRPNIERYIARLEQRSADRADEITYWRDQLAQLQADGVKVWGPADFQPGDYVRYWHGSTSKVLRVNKKSVTIETPYSWTNTLSYDQVRGKIPAAEMEEATA